MNAVALKRRSQAERREEAERAILDAATRIVAAKGLDALTLADAGEAAGYSRGLPSHYFGSKADLLSAIAEYIREWFFTGLRASARRRPGLANLLPESSSILTSAPATARCCSPCTPCSRARCTSRRSRKAIAKINREFRQGDRRRYPGRDRQRRNSPRHRRRRMVRADSSLASARGVSRSGWSIPTASTWPRCVPPSSPRPDAASFQEK